jgi:hypothetical protein
MARDDFGFRKVERLPGNAGYRDFRYFASADLARDTAVAALRLLSGCDAIILPAATGIRGRERPDDGLSRTACILPAGNLCSRLVNPKLPAIVLVVALAPLAQAAAIEVPQTRQEFVQAVADGRGATAVETLTVDQPLHRVYALLQEKATTCLDVEVRRTAHVGYVERSSSDYNPTLRLAGKDRAEFTLQVAHNPRGVGHTPPPGGLFLMAANLRSIDGGRTEIVLYRPTMGVKKIVASLKQWFAGDPAPCPKLK